MVLECVMNGEIARQVSISHLDTIRDGCQHAYKRATINWIRRRSKSETLEIRLAENWLNLHTGKKSEMSDEPCTVY